MPTNLYVIPGGLQSSAAVECNEEPAQTCALCNGRFWIEGNHLAAHRGRDNRLYCSREHAEFGVEKVQQVLASWVRLVA